MQKTKILLFLLCLVSIQTNGQGTITRNKKTPPKEVTKRRFHPQRHSQVTPNSMQKTIQVPKIVEEAAGYDVSFTCSVPNASLYVDGKTFGTASDTNFLKTGEHIIKVVANGYNDYADTITVNRENTSYNIVMIKKRDFTKPEVRTHGSVNGYDWVDLGLSVKWATCNVGARISSDYGNYYAWGETSQKTTYDWESCYDCESPKDIRLSSSWGIYNIGGVKSIEASSVHDPARANWGGSWRLPTENEIIELSKKCTWTWTSRNGTPGCIVKGPNGNTIFLPAGGRKDDGWSDIDYLNENGYYWSNALSSKSSYEARILYIGEGVHSAKDNPRKMGLCVRAVTE